MNKLHKHHKNILAIVIFALVALLLHPTPASASQVSLQLSPPLLKIQLDPPADLQAPLTIENTGSNDTEIKVLFKPFTASLDGNGQIEYLPDNSTQSFVDQEIFQKIELLDGDIPVKTFELGPKQKKQFQLHVAIPKTELPADYYFSIIFLANSLANDTPAPNTDQEATAQTTLETGVATNVLLSIGTHDEIKAYIQEFSSPFFLQSGPVPFTLKIKNAGAHLITPKGVILIKNLFGQTVGRLDLASTNILTNTTRALFAMPKNPSNPPNINLNDPKIIWPEKFLLGPYTATLSIAMSDKGPLYTRTIHFFAMPVYIFLGLLISSLITITLVLRIRKKLKEEK
jgi:hypothetical protein